MQTDPKYRSILGLWLLAGAAAVMAACSTVAGAGEDLSKAGDAVTDAAEDVEEDIETKD